MRFLADENVPVPSLRRLRESGLDVVSVLETDPGLHDSDVIGLARRLGRVLLTFDSDIGERIYKHRDPPPAGVVYLRLIQNDPEEAARVVLEIIAALAAGVGRRVCHVPQRSHPPPVAPRVSGVAPEARYSFRNGLDRRSAPTVVLGPWPENTTVSSARGRICSRMERRSMS